MESYRGLQYHATVRLGNQAFAAIFDTGSFETMVMSSHCQRCSKLPGVETYQSGLSHSFVSGGGDEAMHEFGSGPVLARQDMETTCVGSTDEAADLCAERVPFWQVLDHNLSVWESDQTSFAAIVGLGHPDRLVGLKAEGASSDQLLERLRVERFGVCAGPSTDEPGWLDISPPLGPHFEEIAVVGVAYWAVKLTDVILGQAGGSRSVCWPSCGALVDTGFSLIGAPAAHIAALRPVLDTIKPDCSNLFELPTLELSLGGVKVELPPSAYVLEPRHLGKCAPGIQEVDMGSQFGPVWILGMPFFRRYYTVFDREGPRLHVAPAGVGCKPAPHFGATTAMFRLRAPFAAWNQSAPAAQWSPTYGVPGALSPSWASSGGRLTL